MNVTHEFVEHIPRELKNGVLYVSIPFATAAHKCCCGCGKEVVTPLSPTDWSLIFDGQSISLDPSIGNWSFDCQSHYWIKRNRVKWAARWSQEQIRAGRTYDRIAKAISYRSKAQSPDAITSADRQVESPSRDSLWSKLKQWWQS